MPISASLATQKPFTVSLRQISIRAEEDAGHVIVVTAKVALDRLMLRLDQVGVGWGNEAVMNHELLLTFDREQLRW